MGRSCRGESSYALGVKLFEGRRKSPLSAGDLLPMEVDLMHVTEVAVSVRIFPYCSQLLEVCMGCANIHLLFV